MPATIAMGRDDTDDSIVNGVNDAVNVGAHEGRPDTMPTR
jgi:hypothetical protein